MFLAMLGSKFFHILTLFYRQRIVSMDLQKPRDNKMYYLSEANNLRKMDKALVRRVDKTGIFNHRILSRSEVSMTNKAANQFRLDQSKETTKSEIWKNFTVPI